MSGAGVETVTILITDLVGCTQLESRVGPIVSEELREEHFELLREAVGEAGVGRTGSRWRCSSMWC
jgi:class 3 adenylate cyclase